MSTAKTTAGPQGSNDADKELKPAEKKLLYSALTHLHGYIDFAKVATDIEVPNAEAARKRFRRFLKRQQITTTIKGDRIGESEDEEGSAGTTNAATEKQIKIGGSTATKESKESTSAGKERKVDEIEEDEDPAEIKDSEKTKFDYENSAEQKATSS